TTSHRHPLSLHDALPISEGGNSRPMRKAGRTLVLLLLTILASPEGETRQQFGFSPQAEKSFSEALALFGQHKFGEAAPIFESVRSEEHTSELQSLRHLVC